MNQADLIHQYIKENGSIEPLQALRDLGVYRLAARISDLKKAGYTIQDEWVESTSKITGQVVRFKKYRIK